MRYALLIHERLESSVDFDDSTREAIFQEYMAIRDAPEVIDGAQLKPAETTTTVRVQDGSTLLTDGPFADTKEVFGGYFIVESDTLDTALELAARIPAARLGGAVEVRPIVEQPS